MLKRLEGLGWVEVEEERKGKRGRPVKRYRLLLSEGEVPDYREAGRVTGALEILLFLRASSGTRREG